MKRLFLVIFLFSTMAARDPFYLPKKITGDSVASTTVIGVVACEGKVGCLLCDKKHKDAVPCFVRSGDTWNGYLVQDVTPHSLILAKGEERREITFE